MNLTTFLKNKTQGYRHDGWDFKFDQGHESEEEKAY